MPNLEPVQGQISFTADTSGIQEAESALGGFGSALQTIGNIAAGVGLERIAENVISYGEDALGMVANYETAATSIGTVLGNISDTSDQSANQMGGNASKMADIATKISDEMISYTEKIKDLQDKIAEVVSADNVKKAQAQEDQQLEDLAQAHADKIISIEESIQQAKDDEVNRELARTQNMTDSLADMQTSHDNERADKKEKYEQQMAEATNELARQQLTKKYNDEEALDEDSFQRKYDSRKAQLQRNNDEANAADKTALQKKLDNYQDEIDKEDTSYAQKYAREKAQDDSRIADLEESNAKKLDQYKQELDDEERLHLEHLHKLEEQMAAGGGGANDAFTKGLEKGDPFKAIKGSASDLMKFINDFSNRSPFNLTDIENSTRLITAMGFNAQKLLPIISNIASGTGQSFGTTTQAMLDAVNGRFQMLQMSLGISKEKMAELGANIDSKGHLADQSSLFKAFDKLSQTEFLGATNDRLHNFSGAMSNVEDNLFKVAAALFGIDTASTKTKDGALKALTELMVHFGEFLKENIPNITSAMGKFWAVIVSLAGTIQNAFNPVLRDLEDIYKRHKAQIDIIVQALGIVLYAAIVAIIYIVATLIDWILKAVDAFLTRFGPTLAWIAGVIKSVGDDWNSVVNSMKATFEGFVNGVVDGINIVIEAINKVGSVLGGVHLDKLQHINLNVGGAPNISNASNNATAKALTTPLQSSASKGGVTINNTNYVNNSVDINQLSGLMGWQVSNNR